MKLTVQSTVWEISGLVSHLAAAKALDCVAWFWTPDLAMAFLQQNKHTYAYGLIYMLYSA